MRRLSSFLLVSTSACSLFYDLGALGPGPDADAGAADASDAGDATGESAPPSFCVKASPTPAFCADFDQGDLKKGWANEGLEPDPSETAGNRILIDDKSDQSFDGTRAVAMDLLAKHAGESVGQAVLIKLFDVIPKGGSMLFEVEERIDTGPLSAGANGFASMVVTFGPSGSLGGILFFRERGGDVLAVFEGRTPGAYVQFAALPSGKWVSLRMQIDTAGAGVPDAGADSDASDASDAADDSGAADAGDAGDAGANAGANGAVTLVVDGKPYGPVALPASFASATTAIVTVGGTGGLAPVDAFHVAFDNVLVFFR